MLAYLGPLWWKHMIVRGNGIAVTKGLKSKSFKAFELIYHRLFFHDPLS
jgi:hypothetical protein